MSPRIQNCLLNHNCTIPFTRAYFLLELYTLLKSLQRSVAKNEKKNMKKSILLSAIAYSCPLHLFPYTSSFYLKVFFVGSSNTDIIISEELPYHLLCTLHWSFLSVHLDDTA